MKKFTGQTQTAGAMTAPSQQRAGGKDENVEYCAFYTKIGKKQDEFQSL